MKILNTEDSFKALDASLKENKRTFLSRYGDVDVCFLSGVYVDGTPMVENKIYGNNCSQWGEEVRKEMLNAFKIEDEGYLKALSGHWENEEGMRPGFHESFGYNELLMELAGKYSSRKEWLLPVLFQYSIVCRNELFEKFMNEHVREKKILYIGTTPQDHVEKILGPITKQIRTPEVNAIYYYKKIIAKIRRELDSENYDVVIPSCGQLSRIINGRLWEDGYELNSFDIGSIFDAFEKPTRTWLKMTNQIIRDKYGK